MNSCSTPYFTAGSWTFASADATFTWGKDFAAQLAVGDVVILTGDLGAGKTVLTRGIAHGLGITTPIRSPTFTIARVYAATKNCMGLVHIDLYRILESAYSAGSYSHKINEYRNHNISEVLVDQIAALDIDDYLVDSVVIIEWGRDVARLLTDHWHDINLRVIDDTTRVLTLTNRVVEGL